MSKLIMPTGDDVAEYTDASIPGMKLPGLTNKPLQSADGRKLSELSNEERLELVLDDFDPDFIPVPVGWRILIAPPKISDTFDSGIIKSDATKQGERYMGSWGYLVAVGDGYNRHKVTGEKWAFDNAAPGEMVIHGRWSGQVMKVTDGNGVEKFFHVLNDDEILAICHPDSEVMTATPEQLNNLM